MKMIFVILFFVTSCSSLWSRRSVNVEETTTGLKVVSKEQFDELAKKYQDLVDYSKNKVDGKDFKEFRESREAAKELKENKEPKEVAKEIKAQENLSQLKPEIANTTTIDPSELVNHLDKSIQDAPATIGVDALREENRKGPPLPNSMAVQQVNHTDDIDEQIIQIKEAATLVKVNKFENALALLKDLETSKEKQIVVRAKLMLGDLLFQQGEFDLAMQAYEDIIKKHAFSGLVIKALGKLIVCSEKLKQPDKQAKYYSLLHDFFEAV